MIEEGEKRPAESGPPEVGEREALVLAELGQQDRSQIAFQGLRRKLDLHQEKLSRTLRRLERDGLVQKSDGGYAITEQGITLLRGRTDVASSTRPVRILEALLPPHLDPQAVATHLSRRWFRGLRWYGRSDSGGEIALTWLSEPGNETVKLRIGGGSLSLETDGADLHGSGSLAAARAILAAIAEIYGLAPGLSGDMVNFVSEGGRVAS
jgi:DNA-binding PadR family transcriptional regulator